MKLNLALVGAAALLSYGTVVAAQSAAPAPAMDQAMPAGPEATAPAPEAAPATTTDAAPTAAPTTTAAADGVTKQGGKYMKDGRKATKTEIAEYKAANKNSPK